MKVAVALALLAATPVLARTPARVVSLNLCTDEMLLLAARPDQIASISTLGADPGETPLAARAAGLPTNTGQITDILQQRPDLVLTMGNTPQQTALARRLGVRLLALPYPQSPAEVAVQMQHVATLLGNPAAGDEFARALAALIRSAPAQPVSALMLGGGGLAPAMGGLAAGWLRLAGLRQGQSGPVSMEALIADTPAVLVISRYRSGQFSQPQAWVSHPAVAALRTQRVTVDGRAFLCGGAAMPAEIQRLKAALKAVP